MKAIVVFSGGLDSTVALYHAIQRCGGKNVEAVSFYYGQRHDRELYSARHIAKNILIPHTLVDLVYRKYASQAESRRMENYGLALPPAQFMKGGALTGGLPVPHGHYEAPSMKQTVVPNRNMVFLSIAAAKLMQYEKETHLLLYTGIHAGDHAIYPDCRPMFAEAMRQAFYEMSEGRLDLIAPFIRDSKKDIVLLGDDLKVPFELTWSCYEGRDLHCGKCGTCVERKEAFQKSGVKDPTQYEPA